MKKLIIILTYNEIENIKDIIAAVNATSPDVHILIVDDNSPDGTGKFVDTLIKNNIYNNLLHIIHREKKLGVATGYIEAYRWAIKNNFDVCLGIDADFSHDLSAINSIFQSMNNYDLVIGSRYIKGGNVAKWNLQRRLLSYFGNLYERIILLSNIRDLSGGMNCFRTSLLKKLHLENISSKGYCFHAELKYRATLLNAKIKEIPICFVDRIKGTSKINGSILLEVLFNILILGFHRFKIKNMLTKENNYEKNS